MANTNVNLNKMREALSAAHRAGNRTAITSKIAAESGITDGYFETYQKAISNLYEAISKYSDAIHSLAADADTDAACKAAVEAWKSVLQFAEKDARGQDLTADEHNVASLVGFIEAFMDMQNDRSCDKADFRAAKALTDRKLRPFQKQVETLLGAYINGADKLSHDQRDALSKEKILVNKVKKIKAEADEVTKRKQEYETSLEAESEPAVIAFLKKKISECDTKLTQLESDEATARKNLNEVPDATVGFCTAPATVSATVAEAPKPKKRRPSAKKATAAA
jgi:predicted RNase H-like nuclease (RuvC/YqgF family)